MTVATIVTIVTLTVTLTVAVAVAVAAVSVAKISDKEKAVWEAIALKDVARFEKETEDLKNKGFFMT